MQHRHTRRLALLALLLLAGLAPTLAAVPRSQAAPAAQDPSLTIRALLRVEGDRANAAGTALANSGDGQGAIEQFETALRLYRLADAPTREANVLTNLGLVYTGQGDRSRALAYHEQALQIWRARGDRAGEARTLQSAGIAYRDTGDQARARRYFEQALARWREVGDATGEGRTLANLAIAYQAAGEQQTAFDFYRQALERFQASGARLEAAVALGALGILADDLGDRAGALAYLQQADQAFEELGDKKHQVDIVLLLAAHHATLDEVHQALAYYQRALALLRDLQDREREARELNVVALVALSAGEYNQAIAYAEMARRLWTELGDRAGARDTLMSLGTIYESSSDSGRALYYFDQAAQLALELGDHAGAARAFWRTGFNHYLMGDYARALTYYQRVLEVADNEADRGLVAETLMAVGNLHHVQRNYAAAIDYYRRAQLIWRDLADHVSEAFALSRLARAHLRLGERDQGAAYLDQAVGLARSLADQPQLRFSVLRDAALGYELLGERRTALALLSDALQFYRSIGDLGSEATTQQSMGMLYEQQDDRERALAAYQEAIRLHERIRGGVALTELRSALADQAADVYERAALLLVRLQRPREAFAVVEQARARAFLDLLGSARLDVRAGAEPRLLQREQELRAELAALNRAQPPAGPSAARTDRRAWEALQRQRAALQQEYEDVLTRLQVSNPRYAAEVGAIPPLALADVQPLLDAETTLLSYFVGEEATLVFVVTRDAFEAVAIPVGRGELLAAIEEVRDFTGGEAAPPLSLQRLHAWLIEPVQSALKTRLVGIIPHGPLHYLPFAALSDGQRYLGEDHTLFLLPSASALPFILENRKNEPPGLLALGVGQPPSLPPLPFAEHEARAIADLYATQALVGPAATESALRARSGEYTLIHLAAHGDLNSRRPLFSRIVLAPDPENDGVLEVHEVYSLDLGRADLVVLSACQTQLGAISRGDDLVGLNRAFIYAGAPTVVASLWSVEDRATSLLMESFYRHLREGLGKAEALQAAQAELRRQPAYRHPYYWAAFVLTGDPGRRSGESQATSG